MATHQQISEILKSFPVDKIVWITPFTAGRNCNVEYRGFTVLPAKYKATAELWVDISLTSCTSMEIRHEIAK